MDHADGSNPAALLLVRSPRQASRALPRRAGRKGPCGRQPHRGEPQSPEGRATHWIHWEKVAALVKQKENGSATRKATPSKGVVERPPAGVVPSPRTYPSKGKQARPKVGATFCAPSGPRAGPRTVRPPERPRLRLRGRRVSDCAPRRRKACAACLRGARS